MPHRRPRTSASDSPSTEGVSAPKGEEGSEVELEVTGVAHGGVFVGRTQGRVVFVPDTMPGEVVRARITQDKGSFMRGLVTEVVEPSASRQDHVWPEAQLGRPETARPGGADFGHIQLSEQRQLKGSVISDALHRVGKIVEFPAFEVEPVGRGAVRDRGIGWRTRVGLHVDAGGVTGPMAARSNTVVSVHDLPLAHPDLAALGAHRAVHPGAQRVDLVLSDEGARVLVDGQPEAVTTRTAAGIEFSVLASGFWQVHVDAADTLAAAVESAVLGSAWEPQADNLDLYGGVGLLAAPLARSGARIVTVESDSQASELAARNLASWPAATAAVASTLWYLRNARRSERSLDAATVVLDPPRAGAGNAVMDELIALNPARIVYVACDPVTFARDAGALVRAGYAFASLRAFDLYPNSHHVETLAVFERDSAG